MKKMPLQLRLKRELHKKIAFAQDIIVDETYKIFNNAVLHGGTAIWRCYNGKRFSEDIDFYLPKEKSKIDLLFSVLEKKGFKIIKKKISETSVFSELELERTRVRLEATFQKVTGVLTDYETADGNIIIIYSLTPEMFIKEKVQTYQKRRKVRDLWDIFFLLKDLQEFKDVKNEIERLLENYKPPIDEQDLNAIILEGIIPSVKEMFDYISTKWGKESI